MNLLRDEKGIALVTSLMLTMITLVITMVMLYMVTQSIKTSGAEKAYKTALDAGLGGVDIVTKDALPYLLSATGSYDATKGYYIGKLGTDMNLNSLLSHADDGHLNDACLNAKLTSAPPWAACGPDSTNLDATIAPDISFILKSAVQASTATGYRISAKIISTTMGSSDLSGREYNTSGTTGAPGGDVGSPYIYRLEVTGERESNPKERANLTVLYAY